MERAQILAILQEKLRTARERRDRAGAVFDTALRDAPWLRDGHGENRVQRAGADYSQALHAVKETLDQQIDFLLHGTIPPDIETKPADPSNDETSQ
ncbi:MAG TPA: hypothetical protein VIY49_31575 [Bryobacteraceae bacterium]